MNRNRASRFVASTVTAAALGAILLSFVWPVSPVRAADTIAQTRPLGSFDRIRLSGAFTTEIAAGQKRSQIVISGDRDVVGRVTTAVRNGTLEVGMQAGGMLHELRSSSLRFPPYVALRTPAPERSRLGA